MKNNKKPLVSVITPCYNGAKYLVEAVESVLAQTYPKFECLIVDDGSTDNTRQVSEYLMDKDSRVRYLYKENGGVASVRNFGIKHSRREWTQFLDADDWLHEDKLRFQLDYSKDYGQDEDVVFYSNYEYVYLDDRKNVVRRVTNITGSLTTAQLLNRIATWRFTLDFPISIWTLLIKQFLTEKSLAKRLMLLRI